MSYERAYVFLHPEDQDLEALKTSFDVWWQDASRHPPGWYYWWLGPGGQRDTIPYGPYDTEDDAVYMVASDWAHVHFSEWGCEDLDDDDVTGEVVMRHASTCPHAVLDSGMPGLVVEVARG